MAVTLAPEVEEQAERLGAVEVAVGVLTYNNTDTIDVVAGAAARGAAEHLGGASVALVASDAGSSDDTRDRLAAAGLPAVIARHDAPAGERVSVPFHGVPGRNAGLRSVFAIAHRLGARVLVMLEADTVSVAPEWIARLAGPVLGDKADFVSPAYARHRWEGTITKLLLSPLVRALYGRRLRQPFGGQQALSGRLLEHLLLHPKWDWGRADASDLWISGTAIADGFAVWEAWLGPRVIRSRTRTADLPTMVAQTLGAAFTVMDRHEDLWLEVRGSEALPAVGDALLPSTEPREVDVDGMVESFRLGGRDLSPIWEAILAPETLGEILGLAEADAHRFVFPEDLWARVVYDFALGHHYGVVHRDHLLRSLVPIYLGRTAAYVLATRAATAQASDERLERVSLAFERQKTHLVEHWR